MYNNTQKIQETTHIIPTRRGNVSLTQILHVVHKVTHIIHTEVTHVIYTEMTHVRNTATVQMNKYLQNNQKRTIYHKYEELDL